MPPTLAESATGTATDDTTPASARWRGRCAWLAWRAGAVGLAWTALNTAGVAPGIVAATETVGFFAMAVLIVAGGVWTVLFVLARPFE